MIAFIDIETTGLNPSNTYVTLFGLKLNNEYTIYPTPTKEKLIEVFNYLKQNQIQTVLHNGDNFDTPYLKAQGVHNAFITYDTLIIAYLAGARWGIDTSKGNKESTDGKSGGSLSLKNLAKGVLGDWDIDVVKWNNTMSIINKLTSNSDTLRDADVLELNKNLDYYKIESSDITVVVSKLWELLETYLKKDLDGTEYIFNKYIQSFEETDWRIHNFIMLLRNVYRVTNKRGLCVNRNRMNQLITEKKYVYHELEKIVKHSFSNELINELNHDMSDFNLASSDQLGVILYEKMRLPVLERTGKGAPSTSKSTLKKLIKYSPAVRNLLDYREVKKELEMLSVTLKNAIDENNRIKTTISLVTTKTGRTSSHGPNLQQVKRGVMRSMFEAPPGYVLAEFDYATVEMRIGAEISQDKTMLEAFKNNVDIHKVTASAITGKPISEITKEERQNAKPVNFGFLYGQQYRGFKEYAFAQYDIDFSLEEAMQTRNKFFSTYRSLEPNFYDKVHAMAVANDGILYNMIGRKYYIQNKEFYNDAKGDLKSKSTPFIPKVSPNSKVGIDGAVKNAAINFPVQSLASDILQAAYLEVYNKLDDNDNFILLLTLHDAIYAYIKNDPKTIVHYVERVKEIMSNPVLIKEYFGVSLEVPILADASIGLNWADKIDYKEWLKGEMK